MNIVKAPPKFIWRFMVITVQKTPIKQMLTARIIEFIRKSGGSHHNSLGDFRLQFQIPGGCISFWFKLRVGNQLFIADMMS
jgi:hypothetical protein